MTDQQQSLPEQQEFSSSDIQFVREAVMAMVEKKVLPNNPQEGMHYRAIKNVVFPNMAQGQLIVIQHPA